MTTESSAVENVDASAASGGVGVDTSTSATDANATASSPVDDTKDAKQPTSMLEAVQAALKKEAPAEQSSGSKDGEGSDAEANPKDGEKPAEGAEGEDDIPQPFHKHPAWQRLKAQRDEYRSSHEIVGNLRGFMAEAQLSLDEVNQGFEIMRLMKHDPAAALEAIRPYFTALLSATGKVLPADLKEKVDAGAIEESLAAEMAQMRQRQVRAEADSKRAAEAAAERMRSEISTALSEWENGWKSSDPDYSAKQKHVQREIELRLLRGERPANAAAAVKLASDARAAVEKELGRLIPKKKEEVLPVTGASATGARPEPKSMLDVVKMGGRLG